MAVCENCGVSFDEDFAADEFSIGFCSRPIKNQFLKANGFSVQTVIK